MRDNVPQLPMQSKKFIAYILAETTWKILAGLVLFWGRDSMQGNTFVVLLGIVVIAGFVEAFYIGGQSAVDRYTQLAQIAADTGKSFTMKGLSIGEKESVLKPDVPADDEPKKRTRG